MHTNPALKRWAISRKCRPVKSTVDWQIGDAKIEAYKWLNLAITYGVGRRGGIAKQNVSTFLSENQRNEAKRRASPFYPAYPKCSSEETFDQLFDWFLAEGESSTERQMKDFCSKMQAKTGGLKKFKADIREQGLQHLRNTFQGNTVTKTGGFFKAVRSAWNPNRSSEDWGNLIARNIIEFPYDYLSDTFIQQRENAVNHMWLTFMTSTTFRLSLPQEEGFCVACQFENSRLNEESKKAGIDFS